MSEASTSAGNASNIRRRRSSKKKTLSQIVNWLLSMIKEDEDEAMPGPSLNGEDPDDNDIEYETHYMSQLDLMRRAKAPRQRANVVYVCWYCQRGYSYLYRMIRHVAHSHKGGHFPELILKELKVGVEPQIAEASTYNRSPTRDEVIELGRRAIPNDEFEDMLDLSSDEDDRSLVFMSKRRAIGQPPSVDL